MGEIWGVEVKGRVQKTGELKTEVRGQRAEEDIKARHRWTAQKQL